MMDLYTRFLGGAVRHYDFTWFRAVPGGGAFVPIVTWSIWAAAWNLFTAWTPIGDVPMEVGGLMILENSHRKADKNYAITSRADVDTYCTNYPDAADIASGKKQWQDSLPHAIWNGCENFPLPPAAFDSCDVQCGFRAGTRMGQHGAHARG